MQYLLITFLTLTSMGTVFGLGNQEDWTCEYVLYEKSVIRDRDTYYIGVRVSGFHEKAYFVVVYKNVATLSDDKTRVIAGKEIFSALIEIKYDEVEKRLNDYIDINILFEENMIVVIFDDGSEQRIPFNYQSL